MTSHRDPISTVLPYADLPSRWGITTQRTRSGLRMIVPPVPGVRYLPKSYLWALLPVALLGMSVASWALNRASAYEMIPNFVAYGLILAIIVARAWWRLHTRMVIDVTCEELAIATVSPSGRGIRRSWPRSNVGQVKRNAGDGKLLVRITGQDLFEWPISPLAEVTEWVAQTVNRSLSDEFAPLASRDAFPPIVTRGYRPFLIALAIGLFVSPFLPLFIVSLKAGDWTPVVAILTFGGIGGLTVWIGITMGTQDKEYYF